MARPVNKEIAAPATIPSASRTHCVARRMYVPLATARTQNHAAGWGTMIATWGLATGDRDAVQYAIESFKLAIHDMRPDGSFAADHSRGGNGLSYQNLITGDLVNTAMLLSTSIDVDLFSYEVEGRSIHTAVGYMLDAMDDPVTFNKRYALACPKGGDSPTTSVDNPALDFDLVRKMRRLDRLDLHLLLRKALRQRQGVGTGWARFGLPDASSVYLPRSIRRSPKLRHCSWVSLAVSPPPWFWPVKMMPSSMKASVPCSTVLPNAHWLSNRYVS
jgi:hypothetical protein